MAEIKEDLLPHAEKFFMFFQPLNFFSHKILWLVLFLRICLGNLNRAKSRKKHFIL